MSGVSFPDMVDAIPQIRQALADLDTSTPYTLTEQWPRKAITGNLITVTEITNAGTDIDCVDRVTYQIDVWSPYANPVRKLVPLVNAAMLGIGFRRQAAEQLNYLTAKGGYYRKALRYGRKVDKRTMRLIDN